MRDAIVATYPVIIKARQDGNRRLVSIEASSELVDSEGDCITQKALLDSAESFIKSGHIDIDHLSEVGHLYGIPNPSQYIIGIPIEVYPVDLGDGVKRTGVLCELYKSKDGSHDPTRNKYDEVWESLQTDPPTRWRASIYGFPKSDGLIDCSTETCSSGATRYHVDGIDWRSLAFTKNPVNDGIATFAKIETIKSFIKNNIVSQPSICKDVVRFMALTFIDQTLQDLKE